MRRNRLTERSGKQTGIFHSASLFRIRHQFRIKRLTFRTQGGILLICGSQQRRKIPACKSPVAGKFPVQIFDCTAIVVCQHLPGGTGLAGNRAETDHRSRRIPPLTQDLSKIKIVLFRQMPGFQKLPEQCAVSFQTGLRRKFIRNGKRDIPPVDPQIITAFCKDLLRSGTDAETGHIFSVCACPADPFHRIIDTAVPCNGEKNSHIVFRIVSGFDIIADIGQRTRHDLKPVRQRRSQKRQPEPDAPFGKRVHRSGRQHLHGKQRHRIRAFPRSHKPPVFPVNADHAFKIIVVSGPVAGPAFRRMVAETPDGKIRIMSHQRISRIANGTCHTKSSFFVGCSIIARTAEFVNEKKYKKYEDYAHPRNSAREKTLPRSKAAEGFRLFT